MRLYSAHFAKIRVDITGIFLVVVVGKSLRLNFNPFPGPSAFLGSTFGVQQAALLI